MIGIEANLHPTVEEVCANCYLKKIGICEGETCKKFLNGADK